MRAGRCNLLTGIKAAALVGLVALGIEVNRVSRFKLGYNAVGKVFKVAVADDIVEGFGQLSSRIVVVAVSIVAIPRNYDEGDLTTESARIARIFRVTQSKSEVQAIFQHRRTPANLGKGRAR